MSYIGYEKPEELTTTAEGVNRHERFLGIIFGITNGAKAKAKHQRLLFLFSFQLGSIIKFEDHGLVRELQHETIYTWGKETDSSP